MHTLMSLLAMSLSVLIVAKVLPTVRVASFWTAVGVAVVYGVLKFLLSGILTFLSLPLIFITFGLFYLVINAFLLWITDKVIDGFEVDGVVNTLIASVCISVLDVVFRWVLPGV